MRTLVWFRGKDLRLADHAPVRDAVRAGETIPLFVVDPFFFAPERVREMPRRIRYLTLSLAELASRIAELGSRLVLVAGRSVDVVPEVARMCRVDRVVAHRWSEPVGVLRDRRVAQALGPIRFDLYEGETLLAPGALKPYAVFTPFANAFLKGIAVDRPIAAPKELPPLPPLPRALRALETTLPAAPDVVTIAPGETAARARLARFVRGPLVRYDRDRDRLDRDGTSRLSQDLKFGTISARAVWHATHEGSRRFALELLWREFAYDVLRRRPDVLERPYRPAWTRFPWRKDARAWRAWVEGTTGYPVVDAAARQLLAEGFVPNRARMIAASFLTKHLLVDFRLGEAHYLKELTDGDWANNDLGWQWSAGCGVDAQPWFRIFDPVAQGERFDPDGSYVKRWLPELADVPPKLVHRPQNPIVEHRLARARFLAAARGHLAPGPKRE